MADDPLPTVSQQMISRMLYLINVERSNQGVPALRSSLRLCRIAQAHSLDMASRGYFAESGPDGAGIRSRLERAEQKAPCAVLLYGGPTSIAAVSAWMKGDETRQQLLRPELKTLGVGLVESKWTLILSGETLEQPGGGLCAAGAADEVDAFGATTAINTSEYDIGLGETMATAAAESILGPPPALMMGNCAEPEGAAGAGAYRDGCPAGGAGAALPPSEEAAPAQAHDARPPVAVTAVHATPELCGRLMEILNTQRASAGLDPLLPSEPLSRAAQVHSEDMARRDYFAPASPEGEGVDVRSARQGYEGRCGQSIGYGYLSAEQAAAAFLREPVSRSSLLNPEYVHLGIGVFAGRWTLVYGMPPPRPEMPREPRGLGLKVPSLSLDTLDLGRLGRSRPIEPPSQEARERTLSIVNAERARHALAPLTLSEPLNQVAQAHAHDMEQRDYLGYSAPDGDTLEARVRRGGYEGRSGANLTMGQSTPDQVVQAFMQDEGNRRNVLFPDYREMGVGKARSRWVLLFGIPSAQPAFVGKDPRALQQIAGRVLEIMNYERARAGLPALSLSEPLCRAAQAHAEDMARRGFAGSLTPEGEGVGKRIDRTGYRWRDAAESTALDLTTPEEVVFGWMQAADHRANILDPGYCHAGVGVCGTRWSVIFTKPG